MKKLSVLAAVLAVILTFSLCSCAKKSAHTYWDIVNKQAGDEELTYFATFYLSEVGSAKKIDEIWVNIDTFGDKEVSFDLVFGSSASETNLKYNARNDITVDRLFASDAEGWVKIADDLKVTYKYARVSAKKSMHFNEIYFLTEDRTLLKASLSEAGETIGGSVKRYDLDKSEDSSGEDKHLADNLLDEQDAFDYATAERFYEEAKKKNPELFTDKESE